MLRLFGAPSFNSKVTSLALNLQLGVQSVAQGHFSGTNASDGAALVSKQTYMYRE